MAKRVNPSERTNEWFESLYREMAESRRFELLKPFSLHAFQACALDHYANSPGLKKEPITALLRYLGVPSWNCVELFEQIYQFIADGFYEWKESLQEILGFQENLLTNRR